MAENKTLAGKFAAIMGEIQRVPKTGINKQQNYKFASESDISDMIRELLAKHNVALFVSMPGKPEQTEIQSKSGATGYHTLIEIEYTFVDGDTGEERTMKWHGEADAYDDKGISKATTLAQKYFLLKTFVMSTGDPQDDPDSSSETPAVRTSRPSTVNPRRIPERSSAPTPSEPSESELDAHLGPRPARSSTPESEPLPENPIEARARALANKTCPWDGAMRRQPWQDFIQMYPEWHKKFWPATAALGMDNDMVHAALDIESVKDWTGTPGKDTVAHLWYTLVLAAVESELVDDRAA